MTDKDKLFSICWIPSAFNAEFPTTYLEKLLFWLSDFFFFVYLKSSKQTRLSSFFKNGVIIYLVHLWAGKEEHGSQRTICDVRSLMSSFQSLKLMKS